MQIRGRVIGSDHPPYVIAEVSCNHAGSERVAMALIQVAKDAGAEAVKFQFYTPEGMVGSAPFAEDGCACGGCRAARACRETPTIRGGPWAGQTMYDLYQSAQMPWAWGPRLKAECHRQGLAFIASAYDKEGLDWLMRECVPDALKVASFEATDTPFVEAVTAAGPPVIISLGMMDRAAFLEWCVHKPKGSEWAAWLYCVSSYPTLPYDVDLNRIPAMGSYRIGFSDHTRGHAVACAAVAKGACLLEKHIQLHPSLKTADSHFSATPSEFVDYCMAVEDAWLACQPVQGDPEAASRQFRRAPGGPRGSYGS